MRIDRVRIAWIGLALGPALALVTGLLLPAAPAAADDVALVQVGLSPAGRATAAIAVWMAVWWLTEAVPLAATALLPVVLFPLLDIADIGAATAPYANPLIFLFLGGFLLGLAVQRFGLHRRIALLILLRVGTSPRALIGGFMLASALLSMWISNTATAIMMLPIGVSVLQLLDEQQPAAGELAAGGAGGVQTTAFGTALVLGIAYACSIGGTGTLVGTPPNLVLAAFVRDHYGIDLGMARWLGIGLPLVVVLLPLTWWYLTRIAFQVPTTPFACGRAVLADALARLGPMDRGERVVLTVFALTALGWLLRPQLVAWTGLQGLTDAGIAMLAALILFVIPVDRGTGDSAPPRRALDWDTAKALPWEILILFGGGLSLAAAIAANGVDAFIAAGFSGLAGLPPWVLVLAVAAVVVLLTEITSNTAVTTTLMPVLAATAAATGAPPGMLLTAAALAASCAFMLPVATPPNAIVFASGQVSVPQMARAGLGLNLLAIVVITAIVSLGGRLFLG
jgi:sodium-dependent dicarboxylate transporter 2/3/5